MFPFTSKKSGVQRNLKRHEKRAQRRRQMRGLLFEGLENRELLATLTNVGTSADFAFNLPAGVGDVYVEDDGVQGNGLSQLRSSAGAFDTTVFANPSGSLTINRGSPFDTLIVAGLPDFSAALTGGSATSPFDAVLFAGAVTLAADKSLLAYASGPISLSMSSSDLVTSGTGAVNLTSAWAISLHVGSSITTADGGIALTANANGTNSARVDGVWLNGANLTSTGAGNVSIVGKGGSAINGTDHNGVELRGGSLVSSFGTGSISIMGTGGASPLGGHDGVAMWEAGTAVSSVAGDISITGNGGVADNSLNTGVFLLSNTAVQSTGTAKINITGIGGLGTDENMGVRIQGTVSSVDGDITLNGTATDPTGDLHHGLQINGGQITTTGNANFFPQGSSSGSSGVDVRMFTETLSLAGQQNTIIGNSIALETGTSINAVGKTVTLQPRTAGRAINLGSVTDAALNTLELSNAELSSITASILRIGGNSSGAITVSQVISPGGTNSLHLISGAGVSQTAAPLVAATPISVANLAVEAGGTINLQAANNDVDAVALKATSGSLSFTDTDGFVVGSVDGLHGVLASAGFVDLTSLVGDIQILNTPALYDLNVASDFGLSVVLLGNESMFKLAAEAVVNATGSGTFHANRMDLAGSIEAGPNRSVGLRPWTNGRAINLGSTADSTPGTLELSDSELDRVTATVLQIGDATAGAITISSAISPLGASTLNLITGGVVVDGNSSGSDVTVAILSLDAGSVGAFGNRLETTVSNLTAISRSGGINVIDSDGLAISSASATGAGIFISSQGPLSVNGNLTATGNQVNLSAAGSGSLLSLATGVTVRGSNVSFQADRMNLAGSIQATAGAVQLNTATNGWGADLGSTTDSGASVLELSDAELDRITASGPLVIYGRSTMTISSVISPLGASTLNLLADGALLDGNSSGSDVTVANLSFDAGSVGAFSNRLESTVSNLTAISRAGGIYLIDSDGLAISSASSTGAGIFISSQGPLSVSGNLTATGNQVDLAAAGSGSLLSLASGKTVSGSSVTLQADRMNLAGSVQATTGAVQLNTASTGLGVDLGSATDVAANVLELSDAELDRITADVLQIGNSNAGAITVSAPITHPTSSNFALTSGSSNILFINPGSISTGGGTLTLTPGTVGSVQPISSGIDATTSAASTASFGLGADLAIAINGPTVNSEYHQLNIAGQVNLSGVDLVISGAYIPTHGDSFTLVNNDGTDTVIGTFNGLVESAIVVINGVNKIITYVGGDGNDVVLLADNSSPTNITLGGANVAENSPVGTAAGTLEAIDPDAGDSAMYSLVAGIGSEGNSAFSIVGNVLQTAASFDYETQSSYSIRVRATDSGGLFFDKAFTVNVMPVNDNNPVITSNGGGVTAGVNVAENSTAVTTVTATDADLPAQSLAYTINGGADATKFTIDPTSGVLSFAAPPDYEAPTDIGGNNVYDVVVQLGDGAGGTDTQAIAVTITNVNEAPIDVSLSNASIAENSPIGTIVGTVLGSDPDAGDSLTFTLVNSTGSGFSLNGTTLRVAGPLNFESASTRSITVRAKDLGGLLFDKTFSISVTNVNERPTGITLSNASVVENSPSGTVVGDLSGSDPDVGDSLTYSLPSGFQDNAMFSIAGTAGTALKAVPFDYEKKASYNITVRATDAGGLVFDKFFRITVTNELNEPFISGAFGWAMRNGATSPDEGQAVAANANGISYVTGTFSGTVDFDPGPELSVLTSPTAEKQHFVAKYNALGTLIWAKAFVGGSNLAQSTGIAVDGTGSVYITGRFGGTVDFNPSPGTGDANVANLTSDLYEFDMFVCKLDSSGSFLWAKRFGGTNSVIESSGIALDSDSNVYLTGDFFATIDFNPSPGSGAANVANLTSSHRDIFVCKLDVNGNYVWAKAMGSTAPDEGRAIAVDGAGNVYTTGYFGRTADFNPNPGTGSANVANLTTSGGNEVFVSKLDASGNYVWAKALGGSANDSGFGVAVNGDGDVYVAGNIGSAGFVSKLDATGNLKWDRRLGGVPLAIALDSSSNVYTTGTFSGTADFNPLTGTGAAFVANLESAGKRDVFVSKLNSNGLFVRAMALGGADEDFGQGIAVSRGFGDVFITGRFIGSADFNPAAGPANVSNLVSAGSGDMFLSKLSQSFLKGSASAQNGYLVGSTAFFDANFNGALDSSEPATTTDDFGSFSLEVPAEFDTNANDVLEDNEGQWVVYGGTDSSTGLSAVNTLIAPASWSFVTPLTTLVAALVSNHGLNTAAAMDRVNEALGLPDVDLSDLNPIAQTLAGDATAAQVFAAHARVQDTISQSLAVFEGAGGAPAGVDLSTLLMAEIAAQIAAPAATLDLGDTAVIGLVLENVESTSGVLLDDNLVAGAASVIAATNQLIDDIPLTGDVAYLTQVAKVKATSQGPVAEQLKSAATGDLDIAEVVENNTGAALAAQVVAAALPPTLTAPDSVIAEATSASGAEVNFIVAATNLAGESVPVLLSRDSGALFALGTTTVTASATGNGLTTTATFIVTVVDTVGPELTLPQDLVVPANSLGGAIVTFDAPTAVDLVDPLPTLSWSPESGLFPVGLTTIDVTATDAAGNTSTGSFSILVLEPNEPPVVGTITASADLVSVNTVINVSANFTDNGVFDSHTAEWDWGDGSTSAGIVTESGGSGSVSNSHAYSSAGVYTVTLTVTDNVNDSGSMTFEYIVAYDPSAGFVTGGGWINSPSGAYTANPLLTGKANFGFNSKYQNGNNVPTGNTEFQFKMANFNFKSSSYEWLVISGAKARFRGVGTVNGIGSYGFELTAWDGQVNGGGGVDKFRIKIWNKNQGNDVVYDNMMSANDGVNPTTALGGGSIVIHKTAQPLLASGGVAMGSGRGTLTQVALDQAVSQAIDYWRNTGIDSAATSNLQKIHVQVANLSGAVLGIASNTDYVWIDSDAAGYGWQLNSLGIIYPSVAGEMDLLSVAAHELGHKLGYVDSDDMHDAMGFELQTGSRRLPIDSSHQALWTPAVDQLFSDLAPMIASPGIQVPFGWTGELRGQNSEASQLRQSSAPALATFVIDSRPTSSQTILPAVSPQRLEARVAKRSASEPASVNWNFEEQLLDLLAMDQSRVRG